MEFSYIAVQSLPDTELPKNALILFKQRVHSLIKYLDIGCTILPYFKEKSQLKDVKPFFVKDEFEYILKLLYMLS